jgi:hypothetical protein
VSCDPAKLEGRFDAGATITVEVSCEVSWSDLSSLGLPGKKTVTATSSAPLDQYRRVDAG